MEIEIQKDFWRIEFANGLVQQIQMDFRLTIFISDGVETAQIFIETPFQIMRSDEAIIVIPDDAKSLSPVLVLLHENILSVEMKRNGELIIAFLNNQKIQVAPNREFEAWQVANSKGYLFVCSPGGTVSVFEQK